MPLGVLRVVKTALVAQRAAIEVISQNISSASVPCYTRQRAVMEAIAATRIVDPTKAGQGVRVERVERLWDARLLARIHYERGLQQHAEHLTYGLERIEGIFGDMEKGLQNAVSSFFNAWDVLGADGANLGARREVVGAAQALASMLRSQTRRLYELAREVEAEMDDAVEEANALLQRIADLNNQVVFGRGRVGGNIAGVQRDQACRELAGLIGCTIMKEDDDSVSVFLGGIELVSRGNAVTIELVPDPADPNVHHVQVAGHVDPDGLAGRLRALMDIRDEHVPGYLGRLDELARGIADAVNVQHAAGYDLNGGPGGDFFAYDPSGPAGTLEVVSEIEGDIRLIAAASVPETSSDGENAFLIGGLRHRLLFGSLTAEQYAADIMAEAGADAFAARQAALTRQNVVESLEAKYQERYGVSVDEEAVDLIKYQKAFVASARIAQIVNEMMESLLEIA